MRIWLSLILSLLTLAERFSYEHLEPRGGSFDWFFPNRYRLNHVKMFMKIDDSVSPGSWVRWGVKKP